MMASFTDIPILHYPFLSVIWGNPTTPPPVTAFLNGLLGLNSKYLSIFVVVVTSNAFTISK